MGCHKPVTHILENEIDKAMRVLKKRVRGAKAIENAMCSRTLGEGLPQAEAP